MHSLPEQLQHDLKHVVVSHVSPSVKTRPVLPSRQVSGYPTTLVPMKQSTKIPAASNWQHAPSVVVVVVELVVEHEVVVVEVVVE